VFPSQDVCGQLDIHAEQLDDALAAFARTTGTVYPRAKTFTSMHETATAMLDGEHDYAEMNAGFALLLHDMRDICAQSHKYIESVEASLSFVSNVAGMSKLDRGTFSAARDMLQSAIRDATRSADAFERDWEKRKTLARLQSA
jgi:hypothetical protein